MIRRAGSKYQLVSKHTGRVLGTHKRRADAIAQERAIKIAQAMRGK